MGNWSDGTTVEIPMDKLTDEENTTFHRMSDVVEKSFEKLMFNVSDLELMRSEGSVLQKMYDSEVCSTKRRFIKRSYKKLEKRGVKQSTKVDRLSVRLCEVNIPYWEFMFKLMNKNKISLDLPLSNQLKDDLSTMKTIVEEHSDTVH